MSPVPAIESPRTTSMTAAVDDLAASERSRTRLTAWDVSKMALESVSVFGVVTMSMLCLWVVVPVVVLGWSASAIESGSMRPSIERGDVVLLRPLDRDESLDPGAIIRFRSGGVGDSIIHRVSDVDLDGERYVTQGDANRSVDSDLVPFDEVEGVGALMIPIVGFPMVWIAEGSYWSAALVFVGVLVLLTPVLRPTSPRRGSSSLDSIDRGSVALTAWSFVPNDSRTLTLVPAAEGRAVGSEREV